MIKTAQNSGRSRQVARMVSILNTCDLKKNALDIIQYMLGTPGSMLPQLSQQDVVYTRDSVAFAPQVCTLNLKTYYLVTNAFFSF